MRNIVILTVGSFAFSIMVYGMAVSFPYIPEEKVT